MDYTQINGHDRATAEALLVAAERVGAESYDVRTNMRGFIVPENVAAEYERMLAGETQPVEVPEEGPLAEDAPDDSWKNDEIKAWAEAHGVDLGGATKKADMLAAISVADTEEG